MSAIPADALKAFLNTPRISVVEPKIESAAQPVTLTAVVENALKPNTDYDLSLIVRHSDVGSRNIPISKEFGSEFSFEFAPLPPAAKITSVPIRAAFETGEVRGLAKNSEVTLGDRKVWLAEIRKIEAVEEGYSVLVGEDEPIVVKTLNPFPTRASMGSAVATTDFSKAKSMTLGHNTWTELEYQLVASLNQERVAEHTGKLPLDPASLDVLARAEVDQVLEIGGFHSLAQGLPEFLMVEGAVEAGNGGIRLSEDRPIVTENRHMLDMDFTFEALVKFQADDKIAYLGLGPGKRDRSYNGLTDSVYLRLHAPEHGNGMVDIQNWRYGHSPMNGKIDWTGLHRVQITKKGDVVRFLVDPDNDGPTDDDIELVVPGIREFSPFLNDRNCRIFMSGMGTVTAVRLGFSRSSAKPELVDQEIRFSLGESLPPFLHTAARYRTTRNNGMRILAGGPIQTDSRDFLQRNFVLEADIQFASRDHIAFLGIGRAKYDQSDRIPDSVHMRVPSPELKSEPKVQNGTAEETSMGKPLTENGRYRLRMIKKGDVLEFIIDSDDDNTGDTKRRVTIPNLREFAPYLNSKTSYLFFGGEVEFLSIRLQES